MEPRNCFVFRAADNANAFDFSFCSQTIQHELSGEERKEILSKLLTLILCQNLCASVDQQINNQLSFLINLKLKH